MLQTREVEIQNNDRHNHRHNERHNDNENSQVLDIDIQETMSFFDTLLERISPPSSPFSNNFFPRNNKPVDRTKYKKHKNSISEANRDNIDDNKIDDNEKEQEQEDSVLQINNQSIKNYVYQEERCIICLDIFDENNNIFSDIKDLNTTKVCDCKYYVHKDCLNDWMYTNEKCLMCKSPFQTVETLQEKLNFYTELERSYLMQVKEDLDILRRADYNRLVHQYRNLSGPFDIKRANDGLCYIKICKNTTCIDIMRGTIISFIGLFIIFFTLVVLSS